MSLFWCSWCRCYDFLTCWIDFGSFLNNWTSRSRDSSKGHGHFRQKRIIFIFLHVLLSIPLLIDMVKQAFLLLKKTVFISPTHRRSMSWATVIFKVIGCVNLGYLVHWHPCMWWTYILSVGFNLELHLINIFHTSKFGINETCSIEKLINSNPMMFKTIM